MDYRAEFSDFEGAAYLNVAGQAPMPLVAMRAAQASLEWKKLPHRIPDNLYFDLPDRIRGLLSKLLGGEPEEFAITSGASTGMAAVASGLDWKPGDEVLIAEGEFPAHFSTFMPLEAGQQIRVKIIAPRDRFISAEDFIEHLTPRTRLVSVSLVRFDNASRLDAPKLAEACHREGVAVLLDISQCACAIPMDLRALGCDFAVSSGYKWLLSPFGTGFFWARSKAMEKLRPGPFYWMALEGARNFHSLRLENPRPTSGARRWDAPETANFINLAAMEASLEFISRVSIEAIAAHTERLVSSLIERLPRDCCVLASPADPRKRGAAICVAARKPERTAELHGKLREAQIYVSLREGALRISPHLYNTENDIARLISVLSN
ncbi:MAG TPA: aminotransferase class V-fold PLP-dependent enzyme [Candidatus Acidoferrales bacterium]|nr:aminotransferase class V-fold PLP-dependent enzyme [Candidatus Acidoferrales bacterium]